METVLKSITAALEAGRAAIEETRGLIQAREETLRFLAARLASQLGEVAKLESAREGLETGRPAGAHQVQASPQATVVRNNGRVKV